MTRAEVERLTRLVAGLLVAIALVACTSSAGDAENDPESEAQAAKKEMDAAAKDLLPDLVDEVGGQLTGMQARFYERGGFGIWDYDATGAIVRPPGTMDTALDGADSALTRHGFDVVRDETQKRVTGTKGNVNVIVQAGLLSDQAEVSSLQVSFGTIDTAGSGDSYAEDTPPEDYLAYLK